MQQFPLISVITLNYNQTDATCEFLESCKNLDYPDYEILICDMNSGHSPEEAIKKVNHPAARLIRSDKNLGFAGGNNLGMREARGELFFLVNNDTVLPPDILKVLVSAFLEHENTGAISPKIKFYHHPDILQYSGFTPFNFKTGRTFSPGYRQADNGKYDLITETAGVHGCAMMVSREVYLLTGGLDERFFLYYEEWDWSERIKKAGYKILYCGKTQVLHKDSLTVGKSSSLKEFYINRNRILFVRKHATKKELALFNLYYNLIAYPKNILKYIVKGEIALLKAYLKGVKEGKQLPLER